MPVHIRRMRAFHLPAALLLVATAAAAIAAGESRSVFRHPANHLGRNVRVCGYLIGPANITERRQDTRFGLNVEIDAHEYRVVRRARAQGEYAHICLSGTIRYRGCASGHVDCVDWAYDYSIEVREVW